MKRKINFFYDLISPFAYVALARLKDLPEDIEVKPVPVLLGAILSHWGQLGPAEIEPKRIHTYRLASFLAAKYGLRMQFPPRHPFNSLGALRMLAGMEAGLETVTRAFDFVFRDGGEVDNDAGLSAFAEAIGAPAGLAKDESAKAILRSNTELAIAAGVFGVPTFVVESDNKLFWGVDAFDMLLAYLGDETLFAREPYAHLEKVAVGVRRK